MNPILLSYLLIVPMTIIVFIILVCILNIIANITDILSVNLYIDKSVAKKDLIFSSFLNLWIMLMCIKTIVLLFPLVF